MNKIERVKAAFEGKPVDKIPASFWFHFTGDDRFGENYARTHLEYYKATNIDFMKLMNDAFCVYPLTDLTIRTADDWKALKAMGRKGKYVYEQAEYAARVNDALQGECMTFWTVFEPFSNIFMAIEREDNEEMFRAHLREKPDIVMDAMKAVRDDTMEIIDLVTSRGGCSGTFFSLIAAEQDYFTHEEYNKWIKSINVDVMGKMNETSNYNIGHICGWTGRKNDLGICMDYPVQMLHWACNVEDITWEKGAEFFGSKPRLGGFDSTTNGIIYHGNEEQIRAETRRLVEISGKQGVILGGDCTIPSDTPYEHVAWVMDETYRIG